jgi:hypothetical protein
MPTPSELKMKWAMREFARDERRKEAARDRWRLLKLHAIGATSTDEQRQLFGSKHYPSN